jgi:uncharacterized membrane protein
MTEITFAALLFLLVGVLYIGLGIPLLKGRIPPNRFYGARTRKTLSDERIWYAVNRVTGRDLIIGGVAVMITAVGIQFFGKSLNPNHAATILLTVLVVSVIVMVIDSLVAERTM